MLVLGIGFEWDVRPGCSLGAALTAAPLGGCQRKWCGRACWGWGAGLREPGLARGSGQPLECWQIPPEPQAGQSWI